MTSKSDDSKSQPSTVLNVIPAPGLVLLAIVAIQLGAAISKHLFPILGPDGTVALRIIISAVVLGLVARRQVKTFWHTFAQHRALLLAFGGCISVMNLFFYQAIDLIPLGAAVALEFVGPLGVAAFGSRKLSHFAWVALAALGIILLSPLAGADLNPLGIAYALLAGAGWATFIVLARRVGERISGNDGLSIGMGVAAVIMLPLAIPVLPELTDRPVLLLACAAVALLSTAIPFTLEFEALKRLSMRTYGVLLSMEPAVAALAGAVLLGQNIGVQGMVAVACVVSAAVGVTISDNKQSK